VRLFAGIELDDPARAACGGVIEELRRGGFAAKFEALEKLHVTVAFLGNVEAGRRDEIVGALERTAAATAPFRLSLDKVGAFPHERKPRIVYVGAREQGRDFRMLCTRLRGAYAELGFSFKQDAVAHVTVARAKEPLRPLPLVEVSAVSMNVCTLTLFESIHDQAKNTSRYEVAERRALACGAGLSKFD
jgi:2'-5' RNA ligase